ncbi:MAG: hypothetical protein GY953_58075 [bacterium]|nr:hypothetical protein [bacterium]
MIRSAGAADSVIVTSFDFFKLRALEKEFPGLHSGFAYDDNFLDFCGKWLQKMPELPSENAQAEGNQNPVTILNRLVESNRIGRWIDSSVAGIEHTLVDSDTVTTLRAQQMAVGVFTLFPLDTTFVKKPLPEEEEVALANRLFDLEVDWMECDDPAKLIEIREARSP